MNPKTRAKVATSGCLMSGIGSAIMCVLCPPVGIAGLVATAAVAGRAVKNLGPGVAEQNREEKQVRETLRSEAQDAIGVWKENRQPGESHISVTASCKGGGRFGTKQSVTLNGHL